MARDPRGPERPALRKEEPSLDKKKLFLALQSVLCIALTALMIAAVLCLFFKGAALQEEDPLAWIFTREKLAASLRPILPLLLAALALTLTGLVLGIRDEKGEKPVGNGALPRKASRLAAGAGEEERCKQKGLPSRTALLRLLLLVLAAAMIAAGLLNGSAGDVLGKAIKICTECVGLG